jgi:nitrogen fixation NifU-like protein
MVRRLASRGGADEPETDLDLGKLVALEGVKEFPTRVKCATLAWHALSSALHEDHEPVSTE